MARAETAEKHRTIGAPPLLCPGHARQQQQNQTEQQKNQTHAFNVHQSPLTGSAPQWKQV